MNCVAPTSSPPPPTAPTASPPPPAVVGSCLANPPIVGTSISASSSGGASSSPNSLWNASAAFDGDPTTQWLSDYSGTTPQWLQISFPFSIQISSYTLTGKPAPCTGWCYQAPSQWTLFGSVNGIVWVTLDSQTGQTASPKTYYVTTTVTQTAYSAFRLSVSQNNGVLLGTGTMSSNAGNAAAGVAITELSFCGFLQSGSPPSIVSTSLPPPWTTTAPPSPPYSSGDMYGSPSSDGCGKAHRLNPTFIAVLVVIIALVY